MRKVPEGVSPKLSLQMGTVMGERTPSSHLCDEHGKVLRHHCHSPVRATVCLVFQSARCGMRGGPKETPGIIYKKLCIYSYMFKLQSPSRHSPFEVIHLLRCFSHCSKQFLNLSILMPFSASAGFFFLVLVFLVCFTSSTSTKCFPLRTFFIWGKQTKNLLGSRSGE